MGNQNTHTSLLNEIRGNRVFTRSVSHAYDELRFFRSYLRWMCVDQSNAWRACLSWSMFLLFAIVVPASSHFLLYWPSFDVKHSRPYDAVVQLSLSSLATLSFVCLSKFVRKYGLRRFLFFDKLCDESEMVRLNYTGQLNKSLKIISVFVLPCFLAECAYKVWWYASGTSQIPFIGNAYLSDAVACTMELLSWLYRTIVIFLVCVLFRLICHLQILRLHDFATMFQADSDAASLLSEHLRIRRHLRIISHRFRGYILWALALVTGGQFACLLITTKPNNVVNIYVAGELALCSVTLVASLCILLRSAAKITHKALSITALVSKWHVCATLDSFDAASDGDIIITPQTSNEQIPKDGDSDGDDPGDEEDEINTTKMIPSYAYTTISYQKRQALVNYMENNRAGITCFGILLDRGTIHTIFSLELSLALWLLGKTIGI